MPEQLLDDAQVGPALEQVGRERVAQRVRADPVGEAGPSGRALDRGPRLLAGQPPAAIAEEQRAAAKRARRGRARAARRAARAIQRPSQSSATSPTGTSRSLSPLPMTRTNAPSTDRSSRSSPIASLIRRPAAYRSSSRARSRRAWPGRAGWPLGGVEVVAAGRLQQSIDLLDRQRLGQQPGRSRQVQVRRDVDADQPLAVGEAVEALERGRATPKAARGEAGVAATAAPGPCREVADRRVRASPPSRASPRATPRSRARSARYARIVAGARPRSTRR